MVLEIITTIWTVIASIWAVIASIFTIYYRRKAEARVMSELAPRFNLIFIDKLTLRFFQLDKNPYNLKWTARILENNNNILDITPNLRSGQFEIYENYIFKPFEIMKYEDISNIKRVLFKLSFTDKTGVFKYQMCFLFQKHGEKFKRIDYEYHIKDWFRLKPKCRIDKKLTKGA